MSQEAYCSVRQWLVMKEEDITSKSLKRFRLYILDREKPPSDATPVAATSSSSIRESESERALLPAAAASHSSWSDDVLDDSVLVDALDTFESQEELSASQPVSTGGPKQPPPSSSVPATAERPEQSPLSTSKKAKHRKPMLSLLHSTSKATSSERPEQPKQQTLLPSSAPGQSPRDARPEEPPLTSNSQPASATTLPQSDSPVELEGWVRLWEDSQGIPSSDIPWLKEDGERGLFTPVQTYKDIKGIIRRRRVLKSDRMWFYPPEPPGFVSGGIPTPQAFFRGRFFFWRPIGVWRCSLKCPRGDKCAGAGGNTHLSKSGYHSRVRHICDVSGWYTMATEVVSCGPCLKAARRGESGSMGRWLAWDDLILQQLSEAHRARFPAVLTAMRGMDKTVVRLLRDRTEGNTMIKVWRQVQENHMEDYYQRKDLYTTLLMALVEPGGIVSALGHGEFQAAPLPRKLPSARLLRHAFLLAEADNVQDYRSQILSTFGTVLKMDSTKKVVKKLSGEGKGSAEWFTSIGNEFSQIVSFVLTCEESVEKLGPMCRGVVERFRLANQPAPKILYIDRGCCKAQGPTALETLFQPWVDDGMVVRLDIFHWIHRFDAALRTEAHAKYAAFKSALAGSVLAYNREDLQLLITAVRARDPATMEVVTDENVVRRYISRDQLKHHVRRLTLGAQETFRLVHLVIQELKGPAGLDESGVSLFKSPEAIDEMWTSQQRHLECIQDPPGMAMYRVARTTTINGVDLPYYKGLRGSNSLEGFHKSLPHMIPGPHCAARPYQVYLISGIARWNSDRSSDAVFGGKGRHNRIYSAPLIDRLNSRCQQLFGEMVEENFRAPTAVQSGELLGLEYLFNQSTGEAFSLEGIVNDGPGPEEEVIQPGQADLDGEADEAYQSNEDHPVVEPRITLISSETATVNPPAFEDVCSDNPLPGFQKLEAFCAVLVEVGLTDQKLLLNTTQRNRVLEAWNAVEEHDKQPQKYHQLYRTHWGNTLYCRTKRDNLADAALIQKVKMAKRYAPAQQDISPQHNRLMYVLVKLLWLRSPQASRSSPEKASILKAYDRIQHRVLVDDPILCKAGIPLPKINTKTVRDFIRQQERLVNLHATRQPVVISKTTSVSSEELPPAPRQPAVLPPPDYPVIEYIPTPSTAGTKLLKDRRTNMLVATPQPPPQLPLQPPLPLPVRRIPTTSTITRPVLPFVSQSAGPSSTQPILPAGQASILVTPPVPIRQAVQPDSGQNTVVGTSWSRSTQYKRKLADHPTGLGVKLTRVQHLPTCRVCGQTIQGHKKYKKKTYCPSINRSASKGLENRVFKNYEHFVSVVDGLEE
ncbi:hypothetical protein R3I93_018338 [Phoxinus phoxinus]|uniref:DUF6729 domain-containing protein n=1 Tax=Phoxinus phoxinus TaxID=58324 RepID=A0AAN9CE86_9TELE